MFRVQFFLRNILDHKSNIERKHKNTLIKNTKIFDVFIDRLLVELDKIITPVVAYEIFISKNKNALVGKCSKSRYENFFMDESGWSKRVTDLLQKYSLLFQIVDRYIKQSFQCLDMSLERFIVDKNVLIEDGFICNEEIVSISQLASDRHNFGQQVLLYIFENGAKLIYKPVDLEPNIFFNSFIEYFNIDSVYNVKNIKVLSKPQYGWIEFLNSKDCVDKEGLRNYYRRSGYLLGVLDILNYCDGHFENLFSVGDYPVAFDLETILHNFKDVPKNIGERSILFTGLVEKTPKIEDGKGYTAAFMTVGRKRVQFLEPFVIDDQTDEMMINYISWINSDHNNSPIYDGYIYTAKYYMNEFIEGFRKFFDVLLARRKDIVKDKNIWEEMSAIRTRQVIRHTTYYGLLIRKIHQPDKIEKSLQYLKEYLRSKLSSVNGKMNELVDYEINCILNCDIPYFYHYSNSRDLFDSTNMKYSCYFDSSSMEMIKKRINKTFDRKYLERQVLILEHVLPASMNKIKI